MSSLLEDLANSKNPPQEIQQAFAIYRAYLESVLDALPAPAYAFASASWHYDHNDYRCPHDSWIESVQILEESSGKREEIRETKL